MPSRQSRSTSDINDLTNNKSKLAKAEPSEASCRRGWSRNLSVVDGIAAKHAHPRSKLASSQRHHVLADVGGNLFSVPNRCVLKDPLDQIIAVLVAGNCGHQQTRSAARRGKGAKYCQSEGCVDGRHGLRKPDPNIDPRTHCPLL